MVDKSITAVVMRLDRMFDRFCIFDLCGNPTVLEKIEEFVKMLNFEDKV